MTRPNLFSFATSELSQDAFICWLAAWGHESCRSYDPALHELSHSFLRLLLGAAHKEGIGAADLLRPIRTVVANRQEQSIDVVIEINNDWVLIIEDKTDTSEHSNQLERYRVIAETRWPKHARAYVFLKTGDQGSYKGLVEKGWGAVRRPELLALLREGSQSTANSIFQDFLSHLIRIERETKAFRSTKMAGDKDWGNWERRAWQGFFLALDEHIEGGNWGYVPNARGGFMGYWWCFTDVEDAGSGVQLYLQLAGPQLTVKLHVSDKGRRRALRDKWWRILDKSPAFKKVGLARPNRLGFGKYMTVASKDEYRVLGPDGLLDFNATVAGLAEVMQIKEQLVAALRVSDSAQE